MRLPAEVCARLMKLEKDGHKHVRESQWNLATKCFEEIVEIFPSWEHGAAYSSLGCCHEELGANEKAELNYLKAISYNPGDNRHWGNLASFLYMTQQWERSYQAHLELIRIKTLRRLAGTDKTRLVLGKLARKTGRSPTDVNQDIEIRTKVRSDLD